ncbi:MAG: hypothetical protein Q7T54_02675 [Candidatus Levybacteria bacterium]|nr:hypothetical protein [Candidatus Levybacteria bacterium]
MVESGNGFLNECEQQVATGEAVDRLAELRGQVDPRKFIVGFLPAQGIEKDLGQYLLEERNLLGPTSEESTEIVSGKGILKAFRRARPVSYESKTGDPRDLGLILTGEQIVNLQALLETISRSYGYPFSLSTRLFMDKLIEEYPTAKSMEVSRNPLKSVILKLTGQEV